MGKKLGLLYFSLIGFTKCQRGAILLPQKYFISFRTVLGTPQFDLRETTDTFRIITLAHNLVHQAYLGGGKKGHNITQRGG